MQVGIYDAKSRLSELVKRAKQGEEVILSRHGRTVVKLIALPPAKRILGRARGIVQEVDKDWWKPMADEEAEDFYRSLY
jgi:prevent-host-death family protein